MAAARIHGHPRTASSASDSAVLGGCGRRAAGSGGPAGAPGSPARSPGLTQHPHLGWTAAGRASGPRRSSPGRAGVGGLGPHSGQGLCDPFPARPPLPRGSHSCRAPRTWAAPQGPPLGPSERGPRPLAQWQTGRRTDRHVGRVHGGRAPPGPLRWLCVPPAGEGPGAAGGLGSPPPVPMPGSSAGLLSASSFKKPSLSAYPPPRRRRLRRKVPGPSCPAVRPQLRECGTPHRPCLAGQRRAGHPACLPTRWSLGHSAFST